MITLTNKKMFDLIKNKDLLVNSGRKISRDIEALEIKIKRFEEREKKITLKVEPPEELVAKGDALVLKLTEMNSELEKIAKEINQSKLDAIPKEMKEEHQKLLKEKEVCERNRNKIALKVQKIKDKLIPLVQSEVKPILKDPFDDIETAQATKDNQVVISTFNHIDQFKSKFRR